MRIFLLIGAFLCSTIAYSQGISLFNIDASNFPTMKAKFYAYDKDGKQLDLSKDKVTLKEDGYLRTITKVNCPPLIEKKSISLAMSIDVSGSMSASQGGDVPVELGKQTAYDICNYLQKGISDFALQTCDHYSYIIQDFTSNKEQLLSKIKPIYASGGNDFVEHLMNPISGILNIAKRGKNKRVAVLFTDAWWTPLTDSELEQCIKICKDYDITFYAVIYSRKEAEPQGIKKSLKQLAEATGGELFDGVTSFNSAKTLSVLMGNRVQGGSVCEIEWVSDYKCNFNDVNVSINHQSLFGESSYKPEERYVSKLTTEPKFLYFGPVAANSISKKKITVTAINQDFTISNAKFFGSNAFSIEGVSYPFTIARNTSKELTVVYSPKDKNRHYGFIQPETGKCTSGFSVYGGFPGGDLIGQTLKLTSHNCGKAFTAGIDTLITWEGIPEDDRVMIEYSADSGMTWSLVTDNATGYKHLWKYPPLPATKNGMLRIQQLALNGIDPRVWSSGFELDAVKDVFSPDNNRIAYILNNNSVTVRDALTGELINTLLPFSRGSNQPVITWSGNSNHLAISKDNVIELKDVFTGVVKRTIKTFSVVKVMGINTDGQRLAYGTEDGTVVLIDLSTGRELQRKTGFNFIIGGFVWGADGSFTVTGSCTENYVMKEVVGIPLQEDYSDCTWMMKAPSIKFKYPVIDMGTVIVGSQTDTVLKNSLCNDGNVPIHILGATITSGDYSQFIATNGLRDIVINPGDCFNHEFSFQPKTDGMFQANVTINTTIGDFHDKFILKGTGIPPFIKTIAEYIDFGQVELTKPKDSTVILLKNIGSEIVDFDSIVQGGPNVKDFSLTEKIKKFSLAPGESKTVTLRFTPKELGLTNGRVMAYYKGVGSPAIVQLYGEGIPRILPIESLTFKVYDTTTKERSGITSDTYVIGKERTVKIMDTLTDKILSIDSIYRTDTLFKPLIVITGSIQAVGVDGNNQVVPEAIFKIDLNTSNKFEALLPYIFFEEGSNEIPNRYKRINANSTSGFKIDDLYYRKNTIDVYHDILNIIGKRMTMYPKAVLTIAGRNSGIGIEKDNKELSGKRAENVKTYLRDVWGISEKRLIIDIGNLPKSKSLPLDEIETAQENRRVELSSNDSRITEPLDLKNTVATSNPPKVRFNLTGEAGFGISSYTVQASQTGKDAKSFMANGSSSLPTSIEWEIGKEQAITPKLAKPVTCTFTITDNKGNSKVVGTDEMNIDVITVERKIKEHIDGYEIDNFSLILFDFNKSELDDDNKRIVSTIQKRIKKNSQIQIVGTTDRIGSEEHNARLSQERANSVRTAINRKGASATGTGKQTLQFDNDLPEGRFYCRTVNVTVKTPTN
jgi:outer membrane protein OmpA-like peptidoglycan-associated protein